MWIDGFIIEVYETWPLQLSVDASGELYHVGLLLETKGFDAEIVREYGNKHKIKHRKRTLR